MKTNQIFLLASLLLALLTTLPNAARAQVKIGNNYTTIGSGSNLEVEATGGQKVIVNKADGSMIIQNTPTSTTNTFLLTTDANGLVSKQLPSSQTLPPIITGVLGSNINIATTATYTGASITLPANSKYVVNSLFIMAVYNNNAFVFLSGEQYAVARIFLSDSPTALARTADVVGSSSQMLGVHAKGSFGILSGVIILRNQTNAPKTYYFYGLLDSASSQLLPAGSTLQNFTGTTWGENQIYAIPAN